jgi:hypothetical protein
VAHASGAIRGDLTAVIADAWVRTGRTVDAPVNRVVKRLGTSDTTQATARRAGHLRFAVLRSGPRRTPSAIDAIVAAHAADAGAGVVFTTDPTDLRPCSPTSPASPSNVHERTTRSPHCHRVTPHRTPLGQCVSSAWPWALKD